MSNFMFLAFAYNLGRNISRQPQIRVNFNDPLPRKTMLLSCRSIDGRQTVSSEKFNISFGGGGEDSQRGEEYKQMRYCIFTLC